MQPGCAERYFPVSEKTPEESDAFATPHENRPDLSEMGRNNDHFLTRFILFRTDIPAQEC